MDKETIRRRQMTALQSRHDAGLTDKMIAHAIGCHAQTIGNYRTGVTVMPVDVMMQIDAFFARLGDWLFVEHVCGELAVRRRLRAQQLERQAESLRQQADLFADDDDDAARPGAPRHAARG